MHENVKYDYKMELTGTGNRSQSLSETMKVDFEVQFIIEEREGDSTQPCRNSFVKVEPVSVRDYFKEIDICLLSLISQLNEDIPCSAWQPSVFPDGQM